MSHARTVSQTRDTFLQISAHDLPTCSLLPSLHRGGRQTFQRRRGEGRRLHRRLRFHGRDVPRRILTRAVHSSAQLDCVRGSVEYVCVVVGNVYRRTTTRTVRDVCELPATRTSTRGRMSNRNFSSKRTRRGRGGFSPLCRIIASVCSVLIVSFSLSRHCSTN
jgi:hypothetical protein